MNRETHFQRMRDTSRKVIPFIELYYSEISNSPTIAESLRLFVKRRTRPDQCLLRPYLVRLGYEIAGRSDWERIVPACAAVEIFNISTYQSNIAFDNKYNFTAESSRYNQFISSMLSLDKTAEILLSLDSYNQIDALRLVKRLCDVNDDIYIGQSYDLNELHISKIDLSQTFDEYLEMYRTRCAKLGGSLTALCLEVGAVLGNADSELIESLRKIGTLLGTAGQMVNDIADFVILPQELCSKNGYRECFSDIVNGNVTYLIFYAIKTNGKVEKIEFLDILRNHQILSKDTEEFIMKYLIDSGSIRKIKSIILDYYKALKREVRKLPQGEARNLLSLAFSSLLTNKYFAAIRNY